jgi:nitrogen fixation NifU-like protein
MSDLRDLYQELIVDHYRHPHNFGPLAGANRRAEGFNPLCGDRLTLYLQVVDGVIQEVEALFAGFHALVAGGGDSPPTVALGKLEVLAGVREFPVRVKCATLAWHTLRAALREVSQPVSTE